MKNKRLILTNKFITENVLVARIVPIKAFLENTALLTIYCSIILKSQKNVKSEKEFIDFIYQNYGLTLFCTNSVYGDYMYIEYRLGCINKNYLPNKYDAFSSALELIKSSLFNEAYFDEELIENKKLELKLFIKNNEKNPMNKCQKLVFKQIDPNHRYNLNVLGTIEDIDKINKDNLLELHQKLKEYPISFIYQGTNSDNQYELLNIIFKDEIELPKYIDMPFNKIEPIYNEEYFASPHSYLTMAYHIDKTYSLKNAFIQKILSFIIGEANSILFNEIREKNGLCYSIDSIPFISENIILIITSLSKNNVSKTKDLIDEIISNFRKYCTKDLFVRAVLSMTSEIYANEDDAAKLFKINEVFLYKRNREYNYEEYIKALYSVTFEDVCSLADTMSLVSTYVIKGDH